VKKTGVLLINLGTPDSPSTKDVRKYLTEFLNDPRVIDINAFGRFLLVNGVIVPFRAPKSAKIYKELWELWDGESPLLTYGKALQKAVQEKFKGENVTVELAMRYQNPSLKEVLERMEKIGYDEIIILPLFPHYASASSGSAIEKTFQIIRKWWATPDLKVISNFFDNAGYINAFVEKARLHDIRSYDHIIFSYHGLPERQIEKIHPKLKCAECDCTEKFKIDQRLCYRNECYETSRLIASKLDISKVDYTVSFQSRLGKTPWLTPFSDKVIEEYGQKGMKKILVFSPAFIADCLETSIEIGIEYQEIFEANEGEKIQLVESLNDSPTWVTTVEEMVREVL
jgi:protoporphyrin/coproporphyrin ferrochelatase